MKKSTVSGMFGNWCPNDRGIALRIIETRSRKIKEEKI
jgi:hypothetical protein